MEYIDLFIKSICAGVAALGFAVLFNVPRGNLFAISLLGFVGGLIKFTAMNFETNIVFATFFAASAVGFASIKTAHIQKNPPLIFSIPAVIPMVPGAFAYKFMLGLIALTTIENQETYLQSLIETVNNGSKMMFVLVAIATGVSIPMLLSRKETIKKVKKVNR